MLAEKLDPRNNSLNAIRLLLAATVLIAHAWPLSGHGDPVVLRETPGAIAVLGFFAISGYLITSSRLNLTLPRFAWHRFLRIYPGYWAVLIITAFGLAPAVSLLAGEQWSLRSAAHYVRANVTTQINDFTVPGTLLSTPYGPEGGSSAWNGSTWTLYYEVGCYVIIGLILSIGLARRVPWAVLIGFVGASIGSYAAPDIANVDIRFMCYLGAPFAAGALLRQLSHRVPMRAGLAGLAAGLCVAALAVGQLSPLASLPLAYLVLWCGATWKTQFGRRTDLSYGVYIYAFPVQQFLANLGIGTNHIISFALISLLITLVFAWCSWHLVEKQAMRAKSWTPSLLQRHPRGRRRTEIAPSHSTVHYPEADGIHVCQDTCDHRPVSLQLPSDEARAYTTSEGLTGKRSL